jgi:aminocarboxymuconate-semialdehyde decarboxylase
MSSSRFAIDVHTHFVPEKMPALPDGGPISQWPSMAPGPSCCHRHVMVGGRVYRTVTDQCWSAPKRIADMQSMGVHRQVLSPMPELLSYWMPASAAKVFLRDLNEQMAAVVNAQPDCFSGFAAVPLQDVDMAIAELEYARELGLIGVEIGSNINGRPIGAPEFDSFFAAAARLNMAVFVHAIRPAGMERLVGPGVLEQGLAFPGEIGLAAASAITSNLSERHPGLRLCFSHGGGSLALLLPRLEHARQSFPVLADAIHTSPREQARHFYYDALVYDAATLRHLIGQFGEKQLVLGTDYPFQIMENDPVGRLSEAGLDDATRDLLAHANAARFLGLAAPDPAP